MVIRNSLRLPDSVKLKLNGTFGRWLHLLDADNRLYRKFYRIQTAVWFDEEEGKWRYVSIFPNFIKKYCPPCLNMLEYIGCRIRKGEDIFKHIDDPEKSSIVKTVLQSQSDELRRTVTSLIIQLCSILGIPKSTTDLCSCRGRKSC